MELTKEHVKKYIYREYYAAKVFKECEMDFKVLMMGCQAVIDFINACSPEWKNEILSWWYEEMLPKFGELKKGEIK